MQNLHLNIHAITQTSDLNAPMISDLITSVLKSCHIHVSSVELTQVSATITITKRLPRKLKNASNEPHSHSS